MSYFSILPSAALVYHVHQFLTLYGSLRQFSLQSVEKKNHMRTTVFHRMSGKGGHHSSYTQQVSLFSCVMLSSFLCFESSPVFEPISVRSTARPQTPRRRHRSFSRARSQSPAPSRRTSIPFTVPSPSDRCWYHTLFGSDANRHATCPRRFRETGRPANSCGLHSWPCPTLPLASRH